MGRRRSDALSIYYDLLAGIKVNRNIRKINDLVDDEDPFAYYVVGKIYEVGIKDIEPNAKKSKKYLDKAYPKLVIMANRGNEDAEAILKEMDNPPPRKEADDKKRRPGVSPNGPAVIEPVTTAVPIRKTVDPMHVFYEPIENLYALKKVDKSLRIIRKEMKNNNGYAYYIAGAILRYGIKGLEPNLSASEEYFKQSYNLLKGKEERTAYRYIAALLRDGFGVPIDKRDSLTMFAHASNYGDAKSSVYLSKYYEQSEHFDAALVTRYRNAAMAQGASSLQIEVGFGKVKAESGRRDISINPFPTEQMVSLQSEVHRLEDTEAVAEDSPEEIEESEFADLESLETSSPFVSPIIESPTPSVGVVHAPSLKLDVKEEATLTETTVVEDDIDDDLVLSSDSLIDDEEYIRPKVSTVVLEEEIEHPVHVETAEDAAVKDPIAEELSDDFTAEMAMAELSDNEKELKAENATTIADKYLIKALHSLRSDDNSLRHAAIILAKKAARYGSVRALILLGYAYENGVVVRPNRNVALFYYGLAAENGAANGFYRRGKLFLDTEKEVALFNFKQASKLGQPLALNEIGNLYYEGEMGLRNLEIASRFYELAAQRNDAIAYYNLSVIEEQKGDRLKAESLRDKAYSLGYSGKPKDDAINL